MAEQLVSPYYSKLLFIESESQSLTEALLKKKPSELFYISAVHRKICLQALENCLNELSSVRQELQTLQEKTAVEEVSLLLKKSPLPSIVTNIESLLGLTEVKAETYSVANNLVMKLMEWNETRDLDAIFEISASYNSEENGVDFSLPKYRLFLHLDNETQEITMMKISFDEKWASKIDESGIYTNLTDTFFSALLNYLEK